MTVRVALVADAEDAALAGAALAGSWGPVRMGDTPEEPADVIIALGGGHHRPGSGPGTEVVWHAGTAGEPTGVRVIAQAGPAWRTAPWPVADEAFDLEAPAAPRVLLVGADDLRRRDLLSTFADQGVDAVAECRLTLPALRQASVVVLPSEVGSPLPARAMAVLAARRVLVTGRCRPGLGLLPGIDHVAAAGNDEITRFATAAVRHPAAFTALRAWGRLAAERHRASAAYARVVSDLAMEGAVPPG